MKILFFKLLDDFSSEDFIRLVGKLNPIFISIFYYEPRLKPFFLSKYLIYNPFLTLK